MLMVPRPAATAGALKIGIIANPRCHASGRHADAIAAARSSDLDIRYDVPHTHAALGETLAAYRHAGIGLLVVNGGDGTLRDILTALPDAYGNDPPRIALLPAGNTNLAAWSVGSAVRDPHALTKLLAAARAGTLQQVTRSPLEICWIGQPERRPMRGMLFGAGAFAEAKRIADAEIHRRGLHRRHAVGLTLALISLRTLLGGTTLRNGSPMEVRIDDGPTHAGRHFMVLATALDRLTLGLWPFWGDGAGAIRWLDIKSPPPRLAAALLAILRRRPKPWMAKAGYRSGRAAGVTLALSETFVMDGEFFDPGPHGISLSAATPISFVHP